MYYYISSLHNAFGEGKLYSEYVHEKKKCIKIPLKVINKFKENA